MRIKPTAVLPTRRMEIDLSGIELLPNTTYTFNFGNAVGSMVGAAMLTASGMNYHYPALGGLPLAVIAVALLAIFSRLYEGQKSSSQRQ